MVTAKVTKAMVPAGWPASASPKQVPEPGAVLGGEQRPKCQWHFAALGAPGQGCPGRGVLGLDGSAMDGGQIRIGFLAKIVAVTRFGLPDLIK